MSEPSPDEKRALRRRMRSAARLYAVQALFQMEASGQGADRVRREFEDHRFGMTTEMGQLSEGDVDLFRKLLEGAVDEQVRVDRATDAALVDRWPLGRIDPTLRALFRAAGAELLISDTPPKVIITEYVEIARAFFPEGKEGGLVNAVLDHMAKAFARL
ncbi:transcription antitermination factor NusB [Jannaschia seohaensis]|uniref:Transcription antitermination protein NusB n=1 Tax=Jannaschia seohaensis TaxID=475081 RepID=A0A2Y9A1Z8_9RHOB|nr:transcription antitermination factor NusB [Jannaschia seohaensis]PWJ22293.1 N utilization substance protein B [Jannaschia seohaensis]SSA38571.1 N utilization substance protein B [Jannaschia seohaensis]